VKKGKKPFFLKESAKKEIALEQRYEDLKKEGKLQKFLAKKCKKNSNKDHRWLPQGRRANEED
jgi:ribosomal RNA-processing protein 36